MEQKRAAVQVAEEAERARLAKELEREAREQEGARTADAWEALSAEKQRQLCGSLALSGAVLPLGFADPQLARETQAVLGVSQAQVAGAVGALSAEARSLVFVPFADLPAEKKEELRRWTLAVASSLRGGLRDGQLVVELSRRFSIAESCARDAVGDCRARAGGALDAAGAAAAGRAPLPLPLLARSQAPASRQMEEDAALAEMFLRAGRRGAAVQVLRSGGAGIGASATAHAYDVVEQVAAVRMRPAGAVRLGGTGTAESAGDIDANEGMYILKSIDTFVRPGKKVRAKETERTRTANDFGGAGILTVERREEMDAAADALRNLKLPLKTLLKSAGGKPDGTEAAQTVMFALRCAPAEVMTAGRDEPTREYLELVLAELGLVGDRPLPSGMMTRNWKISTWIVRFITGGTNAVSSMGGDSARLGAHVINSAETRHRRFVYDAFDTHTYQLASGSRPPTGGQSIVWHLYCIERREEELCLCTILYRNLRALASSRLANRKPDKQNAMLRRYLFGHWVLRLTTGIYSPKPAPVFLASIDSPLVDLCEDKNLGKLFDRVLSGKDAVEGGKK